MPDNGQTGLGPEGVSVDAAVAASAAAIDEAERQVDLSVLLRALRPMNNELPKKLQEIANEIANGSRPSATVRELIAWYYRAERRGSFVVSQIRSALDEAGLETVPDFNSTYLDGKVTFVPKGTEPVAAVATPEQAVEAQTTPLPQPTTTIQVDPTYRIGRLAMAHRQITYVSPDASIEEASSLMLKNDFSQLPVMTSDRDVKGLFSWKSYGSRIALGCKPNFVREAMDECSEISVDASLFSAVQLMGQNDCVLVRDAERRISGIITSYDISVTFGQLGEPFLLIGEIEMHVRALIEPRFRAEELKLARDPADADRQVGHVADLSLGECVRLLEKPEQWARLKLQIDRGMFVKDLGQIRDIRNDVMHFDPEGIDDSALNALREFVRFLQNLQRLRPKTL